MAMLDVSFAQMLVGSIVETTLGYLPVVTGQVTPEIYAAIQSECAKTEFNFGSNIMMMSVQSLISHIPRDVSEGMNDSALYKMALSQDDLTSNVIGDIAYKLANSLKTAYGAMGGVAGTARGLADDIERRMSAHMEQISNPVNQMCVYTWGILADPAQVTQIFLMCDDAIGDQIVSDGSPRSEMFIYRCLGNDYKYPVETIHGEGVSMLQGIIEGMGDEARPLYRYMTQPGAMVDKINDVRDYIKGNRLNAITNILDDVSAQYTMLIALQEALRAQPLDDERIYKNLDSVMMCHTLCLGAIQILRDRLTNILVLYRDDSTITLNGDAYNDDAMDDMPAGSITNVLRYMDKQSMTIPYMGLGMSKMMDIRDNANTWCDEQDAARDRDLHLDDLNIVRKHVTGTLLDWQMGRNGYDSPSRVPDRERLIAESVGREVSTGTTPMLDTITNYVVDQAKIPALQHLYGLFMDNAADAPETGLSPMVAIPWLIQRIQDVSIAV